VFKFISKLSLCLTLLSTIGFGDFFVSAFASSLDVEKVSLAATLDQHNDSSRDTDCDDESCADHKCHFGHCPFQFPSGQKFDPPNLPILRSAFAYQGAVLNEFTFRLIKPPCA
jgi:hypothetical protein